MNTELDLELETNVFNEIMTDLNPSKKLERILNHLQPSSILSQFNKNGGWPDQIKFTVNKLVRKDKELMADASVSFNEYEYGCDGLGKTKLRYEEFCVQINSKKHK